MRLLLLKNIPRTSSLWVLKNQYLKWEWYNGIVDFKHNADDMLEGRFSSSSEYNIAIIFNCSNARNFIVLNL